MISLFSSLALSRLLHVTKPTTEIVINVAMIACFLVNLLISQLPQFSKLESNDQAHRPPPGTETR